MRYNIGNSLIFLSLLVILLSCEDPTNVGSGLLGKDDLAIEFADDFSISAKTVKSPPISSYTRTNNLILTQILGVINDPAFGKSTSSVYAEARLSSSFVFPNFAGAKLDSIFLRLQVDTSVFYGNINDLHQIEVFRLRESLTGADTIYSDKDFMFDALPIGKVEDFSIRNSDTLFYIDPELDDTLSIGNAFSIPLSSSLGREILNDSSASKTDEGFKNLLKGLYIRSTTNNSVFGLNISASGGNNLISVYYTDVEGKKRLYNYFLYGVRSIRFNHDYRGSLVNNVFDQESVGAEPLYIQGMAGTNVRLDLSDVLRLKDNFLNYAELELTVAQESLSDTMLFPLARRISVLEQDASGRLVEVADVRNGRTNFGQLDQFYGGVLKYDETKRLYTYKMNLTTHIKKILKNNASPIVYLSILDKVQRPNRVLVNGPNHPTNPLKLKLTYTKP